MKMRWKGKMRSEIEIFLLGCTSHLHIATGSASQDGHIRWERELFPPSWGGGEDMRTWSVYRCGVFLLKVDHTLCVIRSFRDNINPVISMCHKLELPSLYYSVTRPLFIMFTSFFFLYIFWFFFSLLSNWQMSYMVISRNRLKMRIVQTYIQLTD